MNGRGVSYQWSVAATGVKGAQDQTLIGNLRGRYVVPLVVAAKLCV